MDEHFERTEYYRKQHYIDMVVSTAFAFDFSEITIISSVYSLPSWPKFVKKMKIDTIERVFCQKLDSMRNLGYSTENISDYAHFLVSKCLFSCDIAEYAEKIPLIGRLIYIGKFSVIQDALKQATKEYLVNRLHGFSESQSLYKAKVVYWKIIINAIGEFLDIFLG